MKHSLLILTLLSIVQAAAQPLNPVQWTAEVGKPAAAPGKTLNVSLRAKLQDGWHIYSLTTPEGGPTPTTVKLPENSPFASLRIHQPKPETKFDPNFQVNTEVFEKEVLLIASPVVKPEASAGATETEFLVRYQACTEKECLPRKVTVNAAFTVDPKAPDQTAAIPPGYEEAKGRKPATQAAGAVASSASSPGTDETQSLPAFLLLAFGFGLAAIFTPCVFPMIPITLSFFLNRPGSTRAGAVQQAALFCLGIIVLFTTVGLTVSSLLGASGVVQLGSNVWVNAFIASIFFAFGLSLLGAFEITMPSGLLTRLDRFSQGGGVAGTLLMGLTFSLTSFACVGPFMGTLLAGSVGRGGIEPALGMAVFAAGLSTPFFLLALFPAYLQRLPRSGGWLSRVKIVLGFIVLAAALKYLSSIDQVLQLDLLTRERFLAAWFVLFTLPGLYLLGLLRLEGIKADESPGVGRLLSGAAFLIFAFSLLPGMFGARLGEIDALVPLPRENTLTGSSAAGTASPGWIKNDWEAAAAAAKQQNKQVLISFTGYACTNCHWMKANMLAKPEIAALLRNYVLLELYTDGTDAASERNQELQQSKFNTVAIPFYAIMGPDQQVSASFAGLTRDVPKYASFLQGSKTTARL